jgi:tetratricopeptide (TPR) repeat protein
VSSETDGLAGLPPDMAGYATQHFVLADELHGLTRVQRAGAVEAEIFYAARILEALSAEALRALGLTSTANVFANLDVLHQFGLLSPATAQWAHALRRTGNAVRHVQRRVGPGDAELAALFAERWLVWFFREFSHGPRVSGLPPDGVCLLAAGSDSRRLMAALEGGRFGHDDILGQAAAVLRAPALPAVAAEILLERKDMEGADAVLSAALDAFPDDLRLNQLMGLRWSRAGELERARAWLEPLYRKHRDDDETAGITAGVYKRLWHANRDGRDWLARSHKAYFLGWDRSRHTNVYLGINAATTALWLGQEAMARDLARHMHDLLMHRATLLALGRGARESLAYWDQVTLAEALLLIRDLEGARAAYQEAVRRHPDQRAGIEVAREQLEHLLEALGLPGRADGFLGPAAVPP